MPEYPIVCGDCGYRGDVFERVSNIANLKCPGCGAAATQDYERKGVPAIGNRTFAVERRESLQEGWHPKEVSEVRRRLGERYRACVSDDGAVHFRDREEQRGYSKALESLTEKVRAEAHAEAEQRVQRTGTDEIKPVSKPAKPKRRSSRKSRGLTPSCE